jgi:Intracellular proteinase inhibitor
VLAGGAVDCSAGPPAAAPPDSMRLEIVAPPEVPQGEPVPVSLRLTNTADRPITVYLQGRPTAFDIVVTNESGAVVWRRLEGQTITAILGIRTLHPNETITFDDVWPQRDARGRPVPPGTYSIIGLLPTDGPEPLRSPPARVRIRPNQ